MYDGVRGPVRVSRALVVSAAIVALVLVAGCVLLWFTNTSTIRAREGDRELSGAPGDSVVIELPIEQCTSPVVTFQRLGLFGRWQQTHVGQERDIVPWYHIGGRTLDSTMPCLTQLTITIPVDVTWSPVAACTIDMDCFVIDVLAADG